MSRRAQSLPPELVPEKRRGKVVTIICFSWKVFTCVLSHVALVSMVVAYCIAGALIFEHLEADNEKMVKQGIRGMRTNVTDDVWNMTNNNEYLHQGNWTSWVENRLELFERDILTAMKTKGWDGNENEQQMQWTFFGALFYSIIVITTIGYGHIAPKTDMGKVITIFYAILGIPLMLLCLSNIGDVMASSFRFLYWRVCCYVCTREPRRRSHRMQQSRMIQRQPSRTRSQPPPTRLQPPPNTRRSMRISQRSADSGFIRSDYEQNLVHSFSDPQLRHTLRQNDRHRNYRSRDEFHHDTYDERSRHRRDRGRDRHSPYTSRRLFSKYDNYDDMYTERDDRYNGRRDRYNDRRRDRCDERSRDCKCDRDHSPEDDDWNDYDGSRGRQRDRDRDRYGRDRRASDFGRSLDPYYDPEESPRNSRRADRMQRFSNRERTRERLRDRHTVERERNINCSDRLDPMSDFDRSPSPRRSQSVRSVRASSQSRDMNRDYAQTMPHMPRSRARGGKLSPKSRAKSVDPRAMRRSVEPDEYGIVVNRYATLTDNGKPEPGVQRGKQPPKYTRSHSMPRHPSNYYDDRDRSRMNRLEVPETPISGRRRSMDREFDDDYDDDYRMLGDRAAKVDPMVLQAAPQVRRGKQALPPSPRILSPMGFAVHRQAKFKEDYYLEDDGTSYATSDTKNRPVPIWLCLFLVVGYIMAGAFLFSEWEHWSFLDSAYFCFITLTTIGFGDFVPAQGVKENSELSLALCSMYLLFGISLLAMSFNLVQEEVISNVKSVARRLGILKEQEVAANRTYVEPRIIVEPSLQPEYIMKRVPSDSVAYATDRPAKRRGL